MDANFFKFSKLNQTVHNGFTLIEIMVAILILSIGLLGLAQLQASTLRFKTNSSIRSAASSLFSDMADRLRANPEQTGSAFNAAAVASVYTYSATWATQQPVTIATLRNQITSQDCLTTVCTSAQRAAFDLLTWRLNAKTLLPQGSVHLEGNRAAGFTLTLAWFDKNNTDNAAPTCTTSMNGMDAANCCPTALGVASTFGVRCVRMTLIL